MRSFLIISLFFLSCITQARSLDNYKIDSKTLDAFYSSLKNLYTESNIIKIDRLNGESVDLVFHISLSKGKDCFVRFLRRKNKETNRLRTDITQAMSKIWGGPEFLASGEDSKFFITEFIHGRYLKLEDLKNNPQLFNLFIDKLKESHDYLKIHFNNKGLPNYSMAKRAQSRLKEIKDCSIDLPNLEKVQRFLNFIETENLSYRQGVHNDIRPENILLDTSNTVYLIDWAEVTYGNILDDLAAFAEFFDLDQAQEKKLLEHYFHKPVSSDSLKILQRHRWVNGLHRASFKFRRALDSLNEHKPKSWKQALHSDNKNLQKAAYKLQIFLEKGDDSIFYENLEKIQVSTNITIIERVLLWLKTLVKDV